jgi:hypothetical protein
MFAACVGTGLATGQSIAPTVIQISTNSIQKAKKQEACGAKEISRAMA